MSLDKYPQSFKIIRRQIKSDEKDRSQIVIADWETHRLALFAYRLSEKYRKKTFIFARNDAEPAGWWIEKR